MSTSGDVALDIHNHLLFPLHYTSMYVFCCASAGSDGRIGEDRLNACTQLLLVLSPTRRERGIVCTSMQTPEQHRSRCPVSGCGVWKGNLSKRGGSQRWWYNVNSEKIRPLIAGQLDETLAALPCNDHICPNCYKRIRRLPQPPAHNLLDELTAAADEQPPTPPPPPSSPSSQSPQPPPPSSPPPQPPPPPPFRSPPTHQRLAGDSPATHQQLSSDSTILPPTAPPTSPVTIRRSASATKRALIELVNQQLPHAAKRVNTGRVREYTHTEKQYLLDDWEQGDEWTRWGLEWMHNMDKFKRVRWRRTLKQIAALPAEQRPAMYMRRINGQRWSASNTLDAEQRIFDAVMAMRHRRLPVSMKQLRALAIRFSVRQSFKASAKFALSFMRRWRLSQRARTTTKDISSAKVLKLALDWQAQFWRRKFPSTGKWCHPATLWNMDETSVYLDMPPSKTLELVGAKSVEIATTQHEYTRVAVVLCCNGAGAMLDPLVIHKCHKDAKHQNDVKRLFIQTSNCKDICMYVTKNESGWLNGMLMQKWIRDIFTPAMHRTKRTMQQQCLLMDNCSAHTTADVWNAMLDGGFQFEFFPPNCTPILQPCDMDVNREFKRVWTSCWLDWFIEHGSTPANWTPKQNPRKASDGEVHQWIARCMESMTEKVVRNSWDRSVFAGWWYVTLERSLFELVMQYVAMPHSDEWKTRWQMYKLFADQSPSEWSASEASVSGRTRKRAESREEHDRRLEGYAEMERKRRQRYDAPLVYSSDTVEDEKDEEQQLMAEDLVERLGECEDTEDVEDKENRPPAADSSFPWHDDCLMVRRMAEEAEQRKRKRTAGRA